MMVNGQVVGRTSQRNGRKSTKLCESSTTFVLTKEESSGFVWRTSAKCLVSSISVTGFPALTEMGSERKTD